MFGFLRRKTTPWRRWFTLLPMEITYGPGKGREVWLRWYYVRSRRSFGADLLDRAFEPIDD
jgi:hypothetical protein